MSARPTDFVSRLNSIMGILGTTKASFWPGVEATGVLVSGISVGDLIPSETSAAAEALEDDFSPVEHIGGVNSYHFHPTGDHHLAGIDHANFTFGDGSDDAAMSVGGWILPNAIASNVILSKYDSGGNKEEWRLLIDGSGYAALELHDASASATETATGGTVLTVGRGVFVVAAYDGTNATPDIRIYLDAVADNDGSTTESGSYVAMEDTNAPLLVGAGGVTATPTTEFHGRIAMPFVTGKQLSAAEVKALFNIYRGMLGY